MTGSRKNVQRPREGRPINKTTTMPTGTTGTGESVFIDPSPGAFLHPEMTPERAAVAIDAAAQIEALALRIAARHEGAAEDARRIVVVAGAVMDAAGDAVVPTADIATTVGVLPADLARLLGVAAAS